MPEMPITSMLQAEIVRKLAEPFKFLYVKHPIPSFTLRIPLYSQHD